MKEIELDHDDELSFLLGNKSSLVDLTDPPGVAHRRGRNSFSFPVDSLTDIVCLSKRSLFVTGMYSLDSYHVRFPCFFFFLPSLFFCTSFLFCPFSLYRIDWIQYFVDRYGRARLNSETPILLLHVFFFFFI